MLTGVLEFHFEDDVNSGPARTFVLVPPLLAHTFGNTSGAPARLLTIHAPAADAYFAEMHQLGSSPEPPTPDQEREVQRRHRLTPA